LSGIARSVRSNLPTWIVKSSNARFVVYIFVGDVLIYQSRSTLGCQRDLTCTGFVLNAKEKHYSVSRTIRKIAKRCADYFRTMED